MSHPDHPHTPPTPPATPTMAERLAEARAAKAEREAVAQAASEARELLVLDLDAKLSAELGAAGAAFEVLEFRQIDKVVALKRAASVVVKRFDAAAKKKSGQDDADALEYVLPSVVHPTKEVFRSWMGDHPAIVWECAAALRRMEGLRAAEVASKG
jgi:hypothetical protein